MPPRRVRRRPFAFIALTILLTATKHALSAAPTSGSFMTTFDGAMPDSPVHDRNIDLNLQPAALMENRAKLKTGDGIGGTGFLAKLSNGTVVAMTALHVIGDLKAVDLEKNLIYWTMGHGQSQQRSVSLHKLLISPDDAQANDALIMSVAEAHAWPVQVLLPSPAPVQREQTVYLVAAAHEGTTMQTIKKATVVMERGDKPNFNCAFDSQFDTTGSSGAPVVDADGQVVGIHQGHTDYQGKFCGEALAINAALAACTAVASAPAEQQRPAAGVTAASRAKVDIANSTLQLAQDYISAHSYDRAREKLRRVIDSYPDTSAAQQAKSLLQEIKDK